MQGVHFFNYGQTPPTTVDLVGKAVVRRRGDASPEVRRHKELFEEGGLLLVAATGLTFRDHGELSTEETLQRGEEEVDGRVTL